MIQENITPLKKQIDDLSVKLNEVKKHANENEQYSRRCNIHIFGLPELENENCYEVVTEFCKTKLGCDLESCEIDRTHRVGRPRLGKQRAIIVKFCSYQSKIKVMKCKRNLKGTSIYVNEDLTFFNKVFNYAHSELKDLYLILMMLMYYMIDGCPVFVVSLKCMYLVGLLLFVPGINHG